MRNSLYIYFPQDSVRFHENMVTPVKPLYQHKRNLKFSLWPTPLQKCTNFMPFVPCVPPANSTVVIVGGGAWQPFPTVFTMDNIRNLQIGSPPAKKKAMEDRLLESSSSENDGDEDDNVAGANSNNGIISKRPLKLLYVFP